MTSSIPPGFSIEEALPDAQNDDVAPLSITTITARIRARSQTAGQSSNGAAGDPDNGHKGIPSPAPVAVMIWRRQIMN